MGLVVQQTNLVVGLVIIIGIIYLTIKIIVFPLNAFTYSKTSGEFKDASKTTDTKYEVSLQCQNCGAIQRIEMMRGWAIEEAIKTDMHRCQVCGLTKFTW